MKNELWAVFVVLAVVFCILLAQGGDDQFNLLRVPVNYEVALEKQAARVFQEVSVDITSALFFETGSGRAVLYMEPVRFMGSWTTKEVVEKLDRLGLRPASAVEMTAYFKRLGRWPLKKGLSLVALGSESVRPDDLRRVYTCARAVAGRKGMVPISCEVWPDNYMFLGVAQ